jgi:ParB family chromosome partitioning protein
MSRKRGLGKGLDALIPTRDEPQVETTGVLQVRLEEILPNPHQPRSIFEKAQMQELAESIAEHGVLQPLIVSADEKTQGYLLIAGQRRLQAAEMAGLESVPVIVRQVDDQGHLELALIENLQRADLNPLEAAAGYRQLAEDFSLSHEEIAARVGKSRTTISNTLRLLKLPSAIQEAVREGKISEGHARALLGLPNAQSQTAALQTILKRGLNVRQTEALVRRLSGERPAPQEKAPRSPEIIDLEERLREALGTRVTLKSTQRGGSIIIRFYSDEELNTLIDNLLGHS